MSEPNGKGQLAALTSMSALSASFDITLTPSSPLVRTVAKIDLIGSTNHD
jgi:hypothetical protein